MPFPRYPSIYSTVFKCLLARVTGRRRSAHADAVHLCSKIQPSIHYEGLEHIDLERPFVVTANHYARPGITAVLPPEVTWIMTNEWLFEGNPFAFVLRPLMRFVLKSITRAYGYVPMPSMAPGYATPQARTAGVRAAIERARSDPKCILGIAPEGMDSPDGNLMLPPSGVGRFLLHLCSMGMPMLPAAVFESNGCLHIHFGAPYTLRVDRELSPSAADLDARQAIMDQIKNLW